NRIVEIFVAKTKLAQGKKRIFRAFFRQRVHPCDGVPENAISVNQSVNSRLQGTLPQIASRLRRRFHGSAIFSVETAEFEPFKKCRPSGIKRVGILLPALVILFEQIEIGPSGERWMHITLICHRCAWSQWRRACANRHISLLPPRPCLSSRADARDLSDGQTSQTKKTWEQKEILGRLRDSG